MSWVLNICHHCVNVKRCFVIAAHNGHLKEKHTSGREQHKKGKDNVCLDKSSCY